MAKIYGLQSNVKDNAGKPVSMITRAFMKLKTAGFTIGALEVVTSMINDLAVTTGKIADLAVTSAKLAADSVTTAKILDANVTLAKLASDVLVTLPLYVTITDESTDPGEVTVTIQIHDGGGGTPPSGSAEYEVRFWVSTTDKGAPSAGMTLFSLNTVLQTVVADQDVIYLTSTGAIEVVVTLGGPATRYAMVSFQGVTKSTEMTFTV